MKVLVTGGSGMIGSKFVEEFSKTGNEVLYTYLSRDSKIEGGNGVKLDVSDREAVMSVIEGFKPDLTVHCSAVTKVDLCETDPDFAQNVNVEGTKNVVDGCKKAGSKIIYISTSFVFDGTKEVYNEEDEPNAINQYGLTKLKGEEVTRGSGQPFMIIRTDHPYRWSPLHIQKNNIMRMIGLFEKKEKFREATDWFNTPTLVDNLVEAVLKLTEEWENGVYHVVGSDYISRYNLAMKVADAVNGDKNLVSKAATSDFDLPTKRPNVNMSNEKVQKKTGVNMLGAEDGIRHVLKERQKSI